MRIIIIKGDGVIAPYVISSYIKEFRNKGCEIFLYDQMNQNLSKEILEAMIAFKADFAIGYGLRGIIKLVGDPWFFRNIGVPVVALHYDSPFFVIDAVSKELRDYPDMYFHFVWDSYFLQLMIDDGYKNVFPIMLAADIDYFHPIDNIVQKDAIGFVGSFKIDKIEELGTDNQTINNFINSVIQLKLENMGVPVLDICKKVCEVPSFAAISQFYNSERGLFLKDIYFLIHAKGSIIARDYFIKCIDGVEVNIYGDNNIAKQNIMLHPYISYETGLTRVYQEYALNLNISSFQLETSINNRVFDCFASRSFILSDMKYEMEKVFPNYWKEITFSNINEMGEKGEYYLSHEKERKELTGEIYNEIITNHTYSNRANDILRILMDG